MRFSIALVAAVAPYLVSALPFKRAAAGDLTVLKFADALEQLESNFYSQALKKFTVSDFQSAGFSAPASVIQQLTAIGADEATHSSVLQDAIKANGAQPISGCNFDFSSVLVDVPTMAATARVVENVGVGAYLGAAHLVSDPQLLTAAGSILTTEARHQTILNLLSGGGTAIPQAFDIALLPQQVLAIAGPFISGCDLGITPNPTLTVTNTGPVTVGTQLQFNSTALNGNMSAAGMTCQMLVGGQPFSIALPIDQCVVPQGINGPVAIFVTSNPQPLLSDIIEQANDSIVAGPTMAFIDSQPDMLGQSLRQSSSSGGSSSSSMGSSGGSSIGGGSSGSSGGSSMGGGSSGSSGGSSMGSGSGNSSSVNSSAGGSSGSSACNVGSGPNGQYVDMVSGPGGFNTYTGPSADGRVCVNGWTNLPGSTGSNSTSSNSATPSSSSTSADLSSATPSPSSDLSSSSTTSDSSSATPSPSSGP